MKNREPKGAMEIAYQKSEIAEKALFGDEQGEQVVEQENTEQQLIDETIAKYFAYNTRVNQDKKEVKSLGEKLKSFFKIGDQHTTKDGYELSITKQEKTNMNNEKLIEILKATGHSNAVKTIEVPDDKMVEELLYSGQLTAVDIAPAVSINIVAVLKVKFGGKKDAKQKKTPAKKVQPAKEVF